MKIRCGLGDSGYVFKARLKEGCGDFKKLHMIGIEIEPKTDGVRISKGNSYPHKECYSVNSYRDCPRMRELKDFFDYFMDNSQKPRAKMVVKVKKSDDGKFIFNGTYTEGFLSKKIKTY